MTGTGVLGRTLQDALWQAAERLMLHHTNPWELDEALTDWGYATGPCAAQDLVGLDRVLARRPDRPVPILPRMVAEGRLGKKGGVGYYRYPGGGGAVIDPLIEDLIREEARFAGVARSERTPPELILALHTALLAPAAGVPRATLQAAAVAAIAFPADRDLGDVLAAL